MQGWNKMDIKSYINLKPFSLDKTKKRKFFEKAMNSLNLFHYKNSKEYKILTDQIKNYLMMH